MPRCAARFCATLSIVMIARGDVGSPCTGYESECSKDAHTMSGCSFARRPDGSRRGPSFVHELHVTSEYEPLFLLLLSLSSVVGVMRLHKFDDSVLVTLWVVDIMIDWFKWQLAAGWLEVRK